MHLTKENLAEMNKIDRLNLINSVTGIKPANLIGTKSSDGVENLAVFSSVVHLGSNPGLVGFVTRPTEEVRRDTYQNISKSGIYTINHVPVEFVQHAHYTSAKFDQEVSEFEACQLTASYMDGFDAPFVKESPVQLGMKLVQEVPIELNGTILMIGEIQSLFLKDEIVEDGFHLNLENAQTAGISGLNSYYSLKKEAQFPYARVEELPSF